MLAGKYQEGPRVHLHVLHVILDSGALGKSTAAVPAQPVPRQVCMPASTAPGPWIHIAWDALQHVVLEATSLPRALGTQTGGALYAGQHVLLGRMSHFLAAALLIETGSAPPARQEVIPALLGRLRVLHARVGSTRVYLGPASPLCALFVLLGPTLWQGLLRAQHVLWALTRLERGRLRAFCALPSHALLETTGRIAVETLKEGVMFAQTGLFKGNKYVLD